MITGFIRNYFIICIVLFLTDWFMKNISFGYPVGSAFTMTAFLDKLPVLLVTALVLTFLTAIARPIFKFLSAPINFLTLGLFNIVIDVFIFWLTSYLVDGFTITGLAIGDIHLNAFFSYAAVAIVFGLIQGFLGLLF